MIDTHLFWEQSEQVKIFAARSPDKRLVELLRSYQNPKQTRVLDLGCAGGRNTVVLAEQGFDVYAIDASFPMVEKTRERIAAVLGLKEAIRRVQLGKMQDLRGFASESFHLVVALGVYHQAVNQRQWDETLKETVRILVPDAQVLVSNFSPRSDPMGKGLHPVVDEQHVYEGFAAGRLLLLEAEELDAEMSHYGLFPVIPTETVTVQTDLGHRVTVNALYRKQSGNQ